MNTVNMRNIVVGEGIPKICVPIVGKIRGKISSEIEVLKGIPVGVIEWRMDWSKEVECCERVVAMLWVPREAMPEMPILVTFRSKKEGGELEINTAIYVELNGATIDSGNTDLIGVELFTGEAQVEGLIAHTHDKGVRVTISNRDFSKTPSYSEILTRLKVTQILGMDIPKIATIPTYKADMITLLQATNDMHENSMDRPAITMSMAGADVLSRLCGEVFGSALTFGATKKASVPEQTGVGDLKTVLSLPHKSL